LKQAARLNSVLLTVGGAIIRKITPGQEKYRLRKKGLKRHNGALEFFLFLRM